MELHRDFRELLESFNANGVEYLLIGGYALAFHGAPRYTGDLDLLVRPTADNARRIIAALRNFGFGPLDLVEADFTAPDRIIQLGVPPVRVDLVTSITGVSWKDAWAARTENTVSSTGFFVIGRAEFLENKRAIGRRKDLLDAEALEPDGARPEANDPR